VPDQPLESDGLYEPEIAVHSLGKIRRHNYYAALFSKAMSKKWKNRVYIGLYAGAGRALLRSTHQLVETSAIAVFKQEVPFTKYIFVDEDPRCIVALASRIVRLDETFDVTLIQRNVNDAVDQIVEAIPRYDPQAREGLLGLCFVDPFRIDLDFAVIRHLSRFRLDLLVMLPFGFDLRRNLGRYLEHADNDRLAALLDLPDWRVRWRERNQSHRHFVRFAIDMFDEAMERLAFRRREMRDTVSVNVTGMGVYLYSLALYTRHELGQQSRSRVPSHKSTWASEERIARTRTPSDNERCHAARAAARSPRGPSRCIPEGRGKPLRRASPGCAAS
jgi:three-Cys-motif partner protein